MWKRILYYLLCAVILCCWSTVLAAEDELGAEPSAPAAEAQAYPKVPAGQHPRVLVTADDLPQLRERMKHPAYQSVYEKLLTDSSLATDGVLQPPAAATVSNFNDAVLRYIEANSFRYLTEGNPEFAQQAKTAMLNYMATYVTSNNSEMQMREAGDLMYIAAISYDWCYETLTASEKQYYISGMKDAAGRLHIGYPPVKQGAVVGHGTEAQLFRDLLSVGIAIYDEDPEVFDVTVKRLMEDHIPARKFAFQAGFYHQGVSYGSFRGGMEFLALELLDAIGYPNAFGGDMYKMPYHLIYARRPDGELMRDGDAFEQTYGSRTYYPKLVMHAASYYQDPYLTQEFLDQMPGVKWTGKGWDLNYISPSEYMIFYDASVTPQPLSGLPYTRYFPGPVGAMIARTGWETGRSASTVVAEMKVGEYQFANHAHSDAGQFELYYKGGLATDTGVYQGTNSSYGSEHDMNYNKRTIAHNTMLVYDPAEVIGSTTVNDGGQRLPNNRTEPPTAAYMLENGYQTGKVLAHGFGPDEIQPDYSYLKGDLTLAYSPSKVSDFKRSFVFLNQKSETVPAVMVVYDKVSSVKPDFKKYWLLHSNTEPAVKDNTTTITRTDHGYNGKLVNETLLPKKGSTAIEVVEGFDVFGAKYDTVPKAGADRSDEGYSYRVQVSPAQNETTDYFLNVMQVMDADCTAKPLQAELIESSETVGVRIGKSAVLFRRDGGQSESKVTFQLSGTEKKLNILVNDLAEGLWLIEREGQTFSLGQAQVEPEQGNLYFTGPAGRYTLTRMESRVVPNPRRVNSVRVPQKQNVGVEVDGAFVRMNHAPMIVGGTVMMPMAETFQLFDKTAEYHPETRTMTGETDNGTAAVEAGRKFAEIGGIRFELEQAARYENGEVYVPLSMFADCFRVKTGWSAYFNEVSLNKQPLIQFDVTTAPKNPEAYAVQSIEVSGFQEGNEPLKSLDNDLGTRWSVEGDGEWGVFDLGEIKPVGGVGTAWMQGSTRVTSFDILLSEDGRKWVQAYAGRNSGTTDQMETVAFETKNARYVKLVGHGNSVNQWNSLTEIEIYGESGGEV